MINSQNLIKVICINLAFVSMIFINSCVWWQSDPIPSSLQDTVNSQSAFNLVQFYVSQSLTSKILAKALNGDNYQVVMALMLQNKPTGIAVFTTNRNNSYFISLLNSGNIGERLFAKQSNIIHSDTDVSGIVFDEIAPAEARSYLTQIGFNQNNSFLKRKVSFYKDKQELVLVDYIFPNQKTNNFD